LEFSPKTREGTLALVEELVSLVVVVPEVVEAIPASLRQPMPAQSMCHQLAMVVELVFLCNPLEVKEELLALGTF
jgi:hypothetical protein